MAKQTTLWTALPNGYTEDRRSLRISLLVTPRLEPDADRRLRAFPDFVDWPATLLQTRFELSFGGGPTVTIKGNDFAGRTRIDDRLGLPDSGIWQALFPPNTRVHGFEYRDLSDHSVLSYPAADLDEAIRGLYSDLAASTLDQLPTAATFLNNMKWAELLDAVQDHDDRYTDKRKNSGIRDTRRQFREFVNEPQLFKKRDLQTSLARFELFHTPPAPPKVGRYAGAKPEEAKSAAEWLEYEQTPLPQPGDFRDKIDFHRMVSAMNQYPTLLRLLGLVVDVLVSRDQFNPAASAPLSARVHLPPATPGVSRPDHDASPKTRTLLNDTRFQPVPAPAPDPGDFSVTNGLLKLDPKTFKLLQADVDGSISKVMNFARSLLILKDKPQQQEDPVTRKKREIGAPAIRNAGLMLVHDSRGDKLRRIMNRQDKFNADAMDIQNGIPTPNPVMFAEDLIRGYRIDIWDDVTREWHSLCERKSIYDIGSGQVVIDVPSEEGTVRLAATTSPNKGSNPNIIWLHEALVSWAGWSLCAAPPGKTIHHQTKGTDADGNEVIVHEDPVGEPEAEVPPGLRLQTTFQALPGTLPRLRYGRRYWLRARAVDLAGNSLAPQPDDFGPENPDDNAQGYFRFDPISAPALALVKPDADSTEFPLEGESMDLMAVRTFNETPDLNIVATSFKSRRIAVPSRTTHREAEQHGMLDRNGIVDPAFFATLAAQDNSLAREEMLPPLPIPGDEQTKTSFAVMIDGDPLPYLPDPLAVEISARILGHPTFTDEPVITIPFYPDTEWPEALPFKIELYENPDDQPRYDEDTRTLLIPLPKAERATLRLSVRPSRRALNLLGVWNWLTDAEKTKTIVINGQTMTLERLARTGQHWMLTPWRNIELVHAVQRPLITPAMTELKIERDPDKTYARPAFTTTCSIASTDRLDLRATWNDPFDDGPDKPLGNRPRIDHAFSVKITDAQAYAGTHEYFPEPTPNLITVPRVTLVAGRHAEVGVKLHEFHDTRYRRIEYWLEGTSKFREFMPPGYLVDDESEPTEERINVVGPKKRRWVPSSANPPAPEVLYVVPTFGWVRSADDSTRSSWRRGGGLRVYLNRPWNTSGYGEMLAVVLPNPSVVDPNVEPALKPMKNFVTQWGNDPIWESPFVPGVAPKPANFPLARTTRDPDGKWLPNFAPPEEADQPLGPFPTTGRVLPELRGGPAQTRVDIAPHDVFYDEGRQLWYCDIEVNFGAAYFPFIRLALARYQPTSLEDRHLSNAVLADFMQLVPDRWLNVNHTRDSRTRNVRVFGHTYSKSSGREEVRNATPDMVVFGEANISPTSVVEVWVECLDSSLGEDFGWKRETEAIVRDDLADTNADPTLMNFTVAQRRARAKELMIHREFEAVVEEGLIDQVFISPTLWKGSVTLPVTPASGIQKRYRLAVAEYEEYLVDDDGDDRGGDAYDRFLMSKDRRLVFIEYVEL